MPRRRLDQEMVRRGLSESRTAARAAIGEGRVTVGGAPAAKPARLVSADEPVELAGPPPRFVSRAGDKLDAALERFAIDVGGRVALDVGASTGGFTDCLLQRGAARVVAVDVGRNQMHERLTADPRVENRERTDVRTVTAASLVPPPGIAVVDVSFISLRLVLPAVAPLVPSGTDVVTLVKPQFEAGRREVDRSRGVITDPTVWRRVLDEAAAASQRVRLGIMGAMASPIRGSAGNVEFLLHLVTCDPDEAVPPVAPAVLDAAVAEVAR